MTRGPGRAVGGLVSAEGGAAPAGGGGGAGAAATGSAATAAAAAGVLLPLGGDLVAPLGLGLDFSESAAALGDSGALGAGFSLGRLGLSAETLPGAAPAAASAARGAFDVPASASTGAFFEN